MRFVLRLRNLVRLFSTEAHVGLAGYVANINANTYSIQAEMLSG